MPTVPEKLRAAREAKGLSIHQIAEITKIKTEHVRAIEEGNFDVFTAPVYIRGFVRSYGNAVRLDTKQLVDQLNEELAETDNLNAPPSLTGSGRGPIDHLLYFLSQLNWRIVAPMIGIAVLLILVVLGIRAYQSHQADDPLSDLGPGLFQADKIVTGEVAPLPTNAAPVSPQN